VTDPVARPLWKRPALRAVAGETLRPGGFALTDRAAEAMAMLPGWRVLDVGCGLGATMARLCSRFGATTFGVDPDAGPQRQGGLPGVVRAAGDSLPFARETFDAVFCECVLSLLPDPVAGLNEFHRVLADGGWLALSDLYGPGNDVAGTNSCADRAMPVSATRVLAEEAGFEVVLLEDHSARLKDLAARLILAGETGCGCRSRGGLGYYLMLAKKKEAAHV
jgi:SAM-dependent methyltransferase